MTVIEMLVVSTILLTLVGIVTAILSPGLSAWRRGEIRSDLQANAMVSMHALHDAIAASSSASLTMYPNQWVTASGQSEHNDAIAMFSPYDETTQLVTNDGQAVWQSILVYYLNTNDNALWVANLTLPSNNGQQSAGQLLPPDVIQALQSGQGVPSAPGGPFQHIVGRYVQSLQVVNSGGSFVITLETALGDFRCDMDSAVTPTLEIFPPLPQPTATPSATPSSAP